MTGLVVGCGDGPVLTPWMEEAVTTELLTVATRAPAPKVGNNTKRKGLTWDAVVTDSEGGTNKMKARKKPMKTMPPPPTPPPTTTMPRTRTRTVLSTTKPAGVDNNSKGHLAQVIAAHKDECAVDLSDGHVVVTCVLTVQPIRKGRCNNKTNDDGDNDDDSFLTTKQRQAVTFLLSALQQGVVVELRDWSVARIVVGTTTAGDNSNDSANSSDVPLVGLRVYERDVVVVGGFGSAVVGRPIPLANLRTYRLLAPILKEPSIAQCLPHVRPLQRQRQQLVARTAAARTTATLPRRRTKWDKQESLDKIMAIQESE